MKTSKIGEINFGRFKTLISATESVKKQFKSNKESLSQLIPNPWIWYDSELIELTDHNGDGKIDDIFGKSFEIIYLTKSEKIEKLEQTSISIQKTVIKGIQLKYAIVKI